MYSLELHWQRDGSLLPVQTSSPRLAHRDLPLEAILGLQAEARLLEMAGDQTQIIDWCQRAHDRLAGLASQGGPTADPAAVRAWLEHLLPFFMKSDFLWRCREKPRGYAGDYLTIQMMYHRQIDGVDRFGEAVSQWAMEQPCPRAVRNRRELVRAFLSDIRAQSCQVAKVVSLGCGPAAEVFDLADLSGFQFTLVDIDAEAIAAVGRKLRRTRRHRQAQTIEGNIIKMAMGADDRIPAGQTAFYSLGVIDYFPDRLVVQLLNWIHAKLAPGGSALLGNFKPNHPNEAFFRHTLEWPLVLRTQLGLVQLAQQSQFADGAIEMGADAQGIQYFIRCRKPR